MANATRGFLGAIPDADGPGAPVLGQLLPLLDRFDFWFEIVAP